VSRSHAALLRNDRGIWRVRDLGSRGTTLNDEPVPASGAELRGGDKLCLAEAELTFLEPSEEQRRAIAKRRTVPGRIIHPGATLLLLSIFQVFWA
jgi:pSer/pThr/pTyr-binding forkhead associated (FHA) protein